MLKSCLLLMPIFVLLQGAIYLWLSIWGLVLRECSRQISHIGKHPFQYIMDLIYFYDEACGQPTISIPTSSSPNFLNFTKSAEPSENRTFIFLVCYIIISTLWLLSSLWSIFMTLCGAQRNLKLLSFGTWFTMVLAGSLLDAVATGYNIYTLVHTTSANKTFEFLDIKTSPLIMNYLQGFDEYFVAPSIVMTCISSRIVLVWLLNLSGASNCLSILLNSPTEPSTATASIGAVNVKQI